MITPLRPHTTARWQVEGALKREASGARVCGGNESLRVLPLAREPACCWHVMNRGGCRNCSGGGGSAVVRRGLKDELAQILCVMCVVRKHRHTTLNCD